MSLYSVPYTPPTLLSCTTLVALIQNCQMVPPLPCVHIHLLPSDRKRHLWSSKYFSWASVCLCVPFFRRSLYFFIKSFLLLFINFVLIENSYNKQYCVWQVSDLLVCYRNVDFGDILTPEVKEKYTNTTYDLVANIVHDGEPGKGTYRVHVLHKVS